MADPARLAAVGRVLPVAEAARVALDRLAELAAIVMDAPVGIVDLIGSEQQHLVGLQGMAEPLSSTRLLSVEVGFCPETLRAGRPLYIEDAAEDPVFVDHPGYTEMGFSAYAGAPLRDEGGELLGTLCVADTRPHRWRRTDRRALEALAESVVSELALHRDIDRRQRLLVAFDVAPAAIAVTRGPTHLVEYLNPAFLAIFGDLPKGAPGQAVLPELPAQFFALMDQVLTTGQDYRASEASVRLVWPGEDRPRERLFDVSYSAIHHEPGRGRASGGDPSGLLVVAVEVTDRVWARREVEQDARRHELLATAAAALNRNLDPDAELAELARVVVPELADLSVVNLLTRPVPPGQPPPLPVITDRVAVAAAPDRPALPTARGLRWDGDGDPVTEAIRRSGVFVSTPTPSPPRWAQVVGAASSFEAGLRHVAAAPVVVDGLVVAVVWFGLWEDRPTWGASDLAVLGQIARYAGIALGHGMTYQATRHSALVLQRSLLTDPPAVAGLQIAARYRPAGRDEVGGDWYDAFLLDGDDRLAVVIGDVAGHDITAAAAMGQLRASLRTLALDRSGGPAAALDRLAAINTRLAITGFATLLHAHLHRSGGSGDGAWRMRWANAGHPAPLLVTPESDACPLEQARGVALIPATTAPRTEADITLPAGATLLLYTDGLVERRATVHTDGLAAVAAVAAAAAGLPLEQLCDAVLADAPSYDDVALLAIRVQG